MSAPRGARAFRFKRYRAGLRLEEFETPEAYRSARWVARARWTGAAHPRLSHRKITAFWCRYGAQADADNVCHGSRSARHAALRRTRETPVGSGRDATVWPARVFHMTRVGHPSRRETAHCPQPAVASFTAATSCFSEKGFGRNPNFSPSARFLPNASCA